MMLLLMLGTKFSTILLRIHRFCMMVLGVVVWYYVLHIQLINVDICEKRDSDDLKTRSVCTPFVWTMFWLIKLRYNSLTIIPYISQLNLIT